MIAIIIFLWIVSVVFVLIFFNGAGKKEKELEYKRRLLIHEKDKN